MSDAILQSSPGWLPARVGFATASHMNDMLDRRKDGKPGAKYAQYLAELVLERATGRATDRPVTFWMRRGLELEPVARAEFEEHTGLIVAPAAFVTHPEIEWAGSTPDGFIGREGLAEFKVPSPTTFVKWRMAGVVPDEHTGQMTFQLACTGRKWVKFCAYSPEDQDPERALFIRTFQPDPAEIAAAEGAVRDFLRVVDAAFESYCATEPV